jgi:hypothetical protein
MQEKWWKTEKRSLSLCKGMRAVKIPGISSDRNMNNDSVETR